MAAFEEWGEWECPTCGATQEDPESITVTSCANGHTCIIGPVEATPPALYTGRNQRWAADYKEAS